MSIMIFLETGLLITLRFLLFLSCRKYLLRNLYSDLQTLSAEPPGPLSDDSPIELGALPSPSTHTAKPEPSGHLHSTVSRSVFSACFSESCTMFLLLMFQALEMLSPGTRLLNWRFSLTFLLATILVVIPLSLSLLLTVGTYTSRTQSSQRRLLGPRVLLSFIPVGLYLFGLSHIPLPAALATSSTMTAALSRLIVLGTLILGLLSGFGAISNSWAFIPGFSHSGAVPSDRDIASAESSLSSIRNDLRARRAEVERRTGTPVEGTWLSRVVPNFRGADGLFQELQGLEALEYQMTRNLEILRARRAEAKFASTIRGRLFRFGGRLFATYCVVRILSSIANIFRPSRSSATSYPDLITDILVYLLSLFSATDVKFEDVALFSRQLSLVLVGLIILTSIRLVLRGVTRALRITSRNLGASLMLLFLAQLMGMYLLSTVVQIRTSFPPPTARPDADSAVVNLFSTIPEYEVFGSLFDWSFLTAAGASAFVRWGAERVNGGGIT